MAGLEAVGDGVPTYHEKQWLLSAITSQGYDVVWFDKRKPVSSINMKDVFGFIVNVPRAHSPWLYMFTSSSHWYAVRSFNGIWYSLDSNLAQPQIIDDLKVHLKRELGAESSHLIIVNWRKPQTTSVTAVTAATDEEVEQSAADLTE